MSKVTCICILVKLLIVSCMAGTTQITTTAPSITTTGLGSTTSHTVPAVETDPSSLVTVNIILKELQNALWAIKRLSSDPKQIGQSISKRMCSTGESTYSELLSASLKSMLQQLIPEMNEELSVIQISELPKYNNTYDEHNDISEFILKDLKVKGLGNVILSQYIYDFCGLTSIAEMYVPKLEITSSYTLKGNLNDSPISGSGMLSATINMMGAYQQSFMECNAMLLKDDVCELAAKNRTVEWSADKMMVNLSNIKYKNMSESQINFELNEFIGDYLKTDKENLIQKITDLIDDYKNNYNTHQSPASFLEHMERELKTLPTKMDRKQRSLQMANANRTSIILNMFVSLFANPIVQL